ncbi:MAG TPA: type II toxin-antitoxin system VapC family toxin [Thermoanaerobaculia bacterium]|jgi:toxin-antitoxin system PIN domain toxin|nr:type II toxin-antitoxin system VapC family toxin [Thermoanaerobaculia bacterium]
MDLPDVNVLIYAHREDAPEHNKCAAWLTNLADGAAPLALSSVTLGGFLRIVTNPRIFKPATPMEVALAFCRQLLARPTAVFVQPGHRHWSIMAGLIERSGVRGAMVSDAYLAALAIEHGCDLVTTDSDFARFPGLRWRNPLIP